MADPTWGSPGVKVARSGAEAAQVRSPPLLALTLVLAAGAVGLAPGTAHAESVADAQRAATVAAGTVAALQPEVDTALVGYRQAADALDVAVTQGLRAQASARAAAAAADGARRASDQRLRALYMSGGPALLYASVLGATGPADTALRLATVQRIVAVDAAQLAQLSGEGARRQQRARALLADAGAQATAVRTAVDRWAVLADLLARQQAVLDGLSARARLLADAQRAAAQVAAARAAAAQVTVPTHLTPMPIPPAYLRLYQAAAPTCPGLSWTVLAAIGQVESGHGRNAGVSTAGARGPMQFLPATFAAYAVDGSGDGVRSIDDPADAIFTAARYLCANGAGAGPDGLRRALFAYNRADWYVRLVLDLAGQIR